MDFYDITVINGLNVPIEMKALNGIKNETDPYSCGNPGAVSGEQSTSVGGCTWDFSPPSVEYVWVKAGGSACSQDSDCSDGVCGISFNVGVAEML